MSDGFKAPPVTGYNDQSQDALNIVNLSKQLEIDLANFVKLVRANETLKVDQRWAAIAVTSFEQAFMALNRSIFKPDSPFS